MSQFIEWVESSEWSCGQVNGNSVASQMFLLKGVDYLQDDVLKVPRFLLTNLKHQLLQLYQRKLSIAVSDCMIGVALWS
jgi:hypothetical protein